MYPDISRHTEDYQRAYTMEEKEILITIQNLHNKYETTTITDEEVQAFNHNIKRYKQLTGRSIFDDWHPNALFSCDVGYCGSLSREPFLLSTKTTH